MKINEILTEKELLELLNIPKQPKQQQPQRPFVVQPDRVLSKLHVNGVATDIAANAVKRPATELEKVLAFKQYSDVKRQANRNYAARMLKQTQIKSS